MTSDELTVHDLADQPVGAFALPAGLLLVPGETPEAEVVRQGLLAGRRPETWPEELAVHRLAYAGDVDSATEAARSAAAATPEDGLARYQLWVLDPTTSTPDEVAAGLPAGLSPFVHAVAWSIGELDALPEADLSDTPAWAGAVVRATQAADAIGTDPERAIALLDEAVAQAEDVSPVQAATLRGNRGALRAEHGDHAGAVADLEAAAAALSGTDLAGERAELLHQLGTIAHEEAAVAHDPGEAMRRAMHHYYSALQLITEASHPWLWASVQLNLATAHLSAPMTRASDQLRLGIATQALRACRRIFSAEEHPAEWSTATLNLAGALVYTPSTHQGDNLVEAVELYEEVLASRVRDADPVGRARVLAGQGNALAHLGVFDHAKAKLAEARSVFEEHLDHDGVLMVRGILDEIARETVPRDERGEDLAAQAEQMARIDLGDGSRTSGMGVTISRTGDLTGPPPKPKVTVLARRPLGDES